VEDRGDERQSGGRDAVRTFDELLRHIQSGCGRLTPSQQRLADLVLGNPEDCAFMTVTELARSAGVNESTVVRFATSLGLSGYPALSRLCREHLRAQAQLLSRFRAVEWLTREWNEPLTRAATFDRANLERTFARIREADWHRAVDTLATAPRVHVIGLRKC
jgi:DNA-binding MurR/RpiR family transcriptional regulator